MRELTASRVTSRGRDGPVALLLKYPAKKAAISPWSESLAKEPALPSQKPYKLAGPSELWLWVQLQHLTRSVNLLR